MHRFHHLLNGPCHKGAYAVPWEKGNCSGSTVPRTWHVGHRPRAAPKPRFCVL
eukprot:Gb_11001 [translate_table: standard]